MISLQMRNVKRECNKGVDQVKILLIGVGVTLYAFIIWNGMTIKIGEVVTIEIYPLGRFFK